MVEIDDWYPLSFLWALCLKLLRKTDENCPQEWQCFPTTPCSMGKLKTFQSKQAVVEFECTSGG